MELPTLRDRNVVDDANEIIKKAYDECCMKWKAAWIHYQYWIVGGLLLLISGLAVVLILVSSKPYNYPCLNYNDQTLASSVSTSCLQYLWNQFCSSKNPYSFDGSYQGFWNQSPVGSQMVSCRRNTGACGVGSYQNIVIYMQTCNVAGP